MKNFFRENMANAVTTIGIILTFWFIVLVFDESNNYLLIFLISILIGFSDWLDGWLARRWQIVSPLGGFLDKSRDKLYACFAFYYFLRELWQQSAQTWLYLIKGLVILVLAIELLLIAIWIVGSIKKWDTSVHRAGKIKVALYFIAITYWFFLAWLNSLLQFEFARYLYPFLALLLVAASYYGILSIRGYLQRYNVIEEKKENN